MAGARTQHCGKKKITVKNALTLEVKFRNHGLNNTNFPWDEGFNLIYVGRVEDRHRASLTPTVSTRKSIFSTHQSDLARTF